MLFLLIIVLSIWLNHIWLVSNETFILSIFLMSFFLLIYIFLSYMIKIYFFFNISNLLNLLKYSNTIDLFLNKILYNNLIIKNYFLKIILKNKNKLIIFTSYINKQINNFIFLNLINFFLNLKKNLLKISKKNKSIFIKNNINYVK